MKHLCTLLIIPVSSVVRGFVLRQLWAWFIAPHFHIPQLTIPVALGIAALVGFLTLDLSINRDDEEALVLQVAGILTAGVVLFMGWVYTWFM